VYCAEQNTRCKQAFSDYRQEKGALLDFKWAKTERKNVNAHTVKDRPVIFRTVFLNCQEVYPPLIVPIPGKLRSSFKGRRSRLSLKIKNLYDVGVLLTVAGDLKL